MSQSWGKKTCRSSWGSAYRHFGQPAFLKLAFAQVNVPFGRHTERKFIEGSIVEILTSGHESDFPRFKWNIPEKNKWPGSCLAKSTHAWCKLSQINTVLADRSPSHQHCKWCYSVCGSRGIHCKSTTQASRFARAHKFYKCQLTLYPLNYKIVFRNMYNCELYWSRSH